MDQMTSSVAETGTAVCGSEQVQPMIGGTETLISGLGRDMSEADNVRPQCGCGCQQTTKTQVPSLRVSFAGGPPFPPTTALGRIGIDFDSDARRDSLKQKLGLKGTSITDFAEYFLDRANQILQNVTAATSLIWTIHDKSGVAVCAIQPQGAFASDQYRDLIWALIQQQFGEAPVGGQIPQAGDPNAVKSDYALVYGHQVTEVRLAKARTSVPLVQPESDGISHFNVDELVNTIVQAQPVPVAAAQGVSFVQDVLIPYYELLPALAQDALDRAKVFVGTDIVQLLAKWFGLPLQHKVFESAFARPSDSAPAGREFVDVTISVFDVDPAVSNNPTASITNTIDVTDVIPRWVTVRPVRFSRSPRAS